MSSFHPNNLKDDLTLRDFPSSFLFVVICQYASFSLPFLLGIILLLFMCFEVTFDLGYGARLQDITLKLKLHRDTLDKVSNFSLSLWLTSLRCWSFLNVTQCGNFVPIRHCCRWCQTKRRGEGDCELSITSSWPPTWSQGPSIRIFVKNMVVNSKITYVLEKLVQCTQNTQPKRAKVIQSK